MTSLKAVVGTAIAISLTGASAMIVYLMFKKRKEEAFIKRFMKTKEEMLQVITIDITVPRQAMHVIMGRQGCTIRSIEQKSQTNIFFKKAGEKNRVCQITGRKESCELAKSLIQDLLRNQPLILTSDIYVPKYIIRHIVGRCGDNLHQIIVASGAQVIVDGDARKTTDRYAPCCILLKGTVEQIQVARSLIEEKVAEEQDLRRRYERAAASWSPRKNKAPGYLTAGETAQAAVENTPKAERLDPMSSDKSLEVYLSAVESPSQFWVQILSPSATELDQLVEKMTEYYSKTENQEHHELREATVGQMVAAQFLNDLKWYRAQVLNISVDDYNPAKSEVELYYVDYGDSLTVEHGRIFELRTDFLMLRPQAIECSLAKVKPIGDTWSDSATDLFEEITFCAQWKVILCKVDHYDPKIRRKQDRGKREGSPVPVVELFSLVGMKDINVGEELVKNQFAVYTDPKQSETKPSIRNGSEKSSKLSSISHQGNTTAQTTGMSNAQAD